MRTESDLCPALLEGAGSTSPRHLGGQCILLHFSPNIAILGLSNLFICPQCLCHSLCTNLSTRSSALLCTPPTLFYSRYCSVALAGFLDLVQGSLCPSRVLHRIPPIHQSVQHTIFILSCGSHLGSPSTSSPLIMSDSPLHCCFPTLWEIFLSYSH